MEKEGASLVDRPRNISAGEILSGAMRVLLTPYGDRFRKMRRYAPVSLIGRITDFTSQGTAFSPPIKGRRGLRACADTRCKSSRN